PRVDMERVGREDPVVVFLDVGRLHEQVPVPHVDEGRQGAVGVQQKVAVGQFLGAIAEVMDIQVSVELDDEGVPSGSAKLLVNGKDTQMVARDPEEKILVAKDAFHEAPAALPPAPIGCQRLEVQASYPDLAAIGAGSRRRALATIVGEDLSERVGEEIGTPSGAGTTKEIERKEYGAGVHGLLIFYRVADTVQCLHESGGTRPMRSAPGPKADPGRTAKMQAIQDYYIAPGAVVTGDVGLAAGVNIWYGAVIRGDLARVTLGPRVNVQDGSIIHTDYDLPQVIEEGVVVGHRAVLHGRRVGRGTLVGMGALLLSGCDIGEECLIAAGA